MKFNNFVIFFAVFYGLIHFKNNLKIGIDKDLWVW